MEKSSIKQIILEQKDLFNKKLKIVERAIPDNILKSPKIVVITGVRRCGKSTLLRQLSATLKGGNYFNFEDERLIDFTYNDFNNLLEAFLELNPSDKVFFFDEIQEIYGWEKFVRRIFEDGYKVFVTGSNARLLSSEISTSLTGRNLRLELLPFSFKEYLLMHDFVLKQNYTTKEKAFISNFVREYLAYGGFPEVILTKDKEELNLIYQDIIIKDLLVRFKIRDTKAFRELALYLLSNCSKKMSLNNLKTLLSFSTTTKVKNYVDFLSEAYLFFLVPKYDVSIKKQIINDKKVYVIDTGLINTVAFQFTENRGRILENAVFLELKRNKKEIFYFADTSECDFLIRSNNRITAAIQVSVSLANPKTQKRELDGLLAAMNKFGLKHGLIITETEEKLWTIAGKKIRIIPLWKFLLSLEREI